MVANLILNDPLASRSIHTTLGSKVTPSNENKVLSSASLAVEMMILPAVMYCATPALIHEVTTKLDMY